MTTISKFYLLDAATPNIGTMPTNSPTTIAGGVVGTGIEATGASTARDTSDVKGTANPDTESSITAQAAATNQRLGHRRFVSRPLAARTFALADGAWTFSYARSQSNTSHSNGIDPLINCAIYLWRPSTGLQVGTVAIFISGATLTVTAETVDSKTGQWNGTQAILNGDILVMDVYSTFTQTMATAYTDQFAYNGITEASTVTCASFITPPAALTLYVPASLVPERSERRRNIHRRVAASYDRW